MQGVLDKDITSLAVCLKHSFLFPEHEQKVGELARSMGFKQISLSSEVMPMVKMVPRGYTAAADAYLTPHIMRFALPLLLPALALLCPTLLCLALPLLEKDIPAAPSPSIADGFTPCPYLQGLVTNKGTFHMLHHCLCSPHCAVCLQHAYQGSERLDFDAAP